MGGMFGVVSRKDCVTDLFFGIDYHSHLGTKKGGIAVYGENGFNRAIHNISNSPFRTKFENDIKEMSGKMGIGCISDNEPQPLLINCRLGSYAIVSVGRVANMEELIQDAFDNGHTHFLEMSGGEVNQTELIAAMINQKDTYVDGIINVLRKVKGSISFMLMTKDGLYLVRDKLGRTPLNIGKGENGFCASFESHAYINLGYSLYKELGPGEVCFMTSEEVKTLVEANDKMKICSLPDHLGRQVGGRGFVPEGRRFQGGTVALRRRRGQIEHRRRQGQAPDRPVLVSLAEYPIVRQEHIQVGSVPPRGFVGGKGCGKHQPRR